MTDLVPSDAPATYAIGDLHGEVTLLHQLLAALPLHDEDTVVFLGDYLNRGEDSAATIAALRAFGRTHQHCVFLRGNHEDRWLTYWDGIRFTAVPEIDGADKAWDDFGGAIPVEVGHGWRGP